MFDNLFLVMEKGLFIETGASQTHNKSLREK